MENMELQVIDYDSDGKAVCAHHKLRRCDDCGLDFTYSDPDSDIDTEDGSIESAGDIGPNEESQNQPGASGPQVNELPDIGAMSVEEEYYDLKEEKLQEWYPRFIPQWDEQVCGREIFSLPKDPNSPPKPLDRDQLKTVYCEDCAVTWLQGVRGEKGGIHPTHTSHNPDPFLVTGQRTILVHIDGACLGSGGEESVAGFGIYHGHEKSNNNKVVRLGPKRAATVQVAELCAVLHALKWLRKNFLPFWRQILSHKLKGPVEDFVGLWHLRLVVATDSSYIIDSLCSNLKKWSWNPSTKTFRNAKGKVIKNSDLFAAILDEGQRLIQEPERVIVLWYHIDKEFNTEADRLAHQAVRRTIPRAQQGGPPTQNENSGCGPM
ncbi:ribonuclease H-like domain-containing protein [Whalleya microplaca]|nr:ribonuclease H-like domain-containing protein [Whalleya microplaca]